MKNPLVLHIPHASLYIPQEYLPLFTVDPQELRRELLCMTDRYTDELFPGSCPSVIAPVSRLLCDMERFRMDEAETMARIGMGVCYEKGSRLQPLKQVSRAHRREVLQRYYDPHHALLTKTVKTQLDQHGSCLLIDVHSFASRPLPYEPVQLQSRPMICLGTDPFHTPDWLVQRAEELFRQRGFSVAVNTPYSGVLVPMDFYHRDAHLQALMIEVNRSLYMNEMTGEKHSGFKTMQQVLS